MNKDNLTVKEAQKKVHRFISKFCGGYWEPLCNLTRLVEEVGEFARELNHKYGKKIKKDTEPHGNIREEIGDILFSVICLANYEKIDLESSLKYVLKKYKKRDQNRWMKK